MIDQELEKLPGDLDALLDAERSAPGPSGDVRSRLRSRVVASIAPALPADPSTAGSPAASSAAASTATALSPLARLAIAVFVGGGVSAGVLAVWSAKNQDEATTGPAIVEPLIDDRVTPPREEAAVPAIAPAVPAEQPTTNAVKDDKPARTPRPGVHDDRLAAERALIEDARSALSRGDGHAAMAALARHRLRFQKGELTEERESLKVLALVRLGEHDAARKLGAEIKARYPRSIFLPMIDASLESIP